MKRAIATITKFVNTHFSKIAFLFVLWELVFNIVIIRFVPYTEIDWKAYMQEVEGYLNGDWNYAHLRGDTGPLVYPGGFVYIFSILYQITNSGENVRRAQYIFAGLYCLMIAIVFWIYYKALIQKKNSENGYTANGLFILLALILSKRIHSIFVLRLFNDCVAMLLLYISVLALIKNQWSTGCFLFSCALSVKMNILLFLPGLLVLLVKRFGFFGMIPKALIIFGFQVLVGVPFGLFSWKNYLSRAFSFSRKFLFKWTVNYRFLSEDVFLSDNFGRMLLLGMLVTLCLYGLWRWTEWEGVFNVLFGKYKKENPKQELTAHHIVYVLFTSNFIGITFSKSLHYQFYVWYFHTLPFLLHCARLPLLLQIMMMAGIEYCWNVYPSTTFSSALLTGLHAFLLLMITFSRSEYPYTTKGKKEKQL